MAEYFATREGMIGIINQHLVWGSDAEAILDSINDYKAQFAYKCSHSSCPLRKKPSYRRNGEPGFPSREALEEHRLTHPNHGIRTIRRSIIGTPWYECECHHIDHLNDTELDLWWINKFDGEPQSRREHLEKVNGSRV